MSDCPMGFDCLNMGKEAPERGCVNYQECGLTRTRRTDYPISFSREYNIDGTRFCEQRVKWDENFFAEAKKIPFAYTSEGFLEVFTNDSKSEGFARAVNLPYRIFEELIQDGSAISVLVVERFVSQEAREMGWHEARPIPIEQVVYGAALVAAASCEKSKRLENFKLLVEDIRFSLLMTAEDICSDGDDEDDD